MLKTICLLAATCLVSIPLNAQSSPSAEGRGIAIWVGASISTFNPDYGCSENSPVKCWKYQLLGIAPFAHTNPFLFQRIGAEGQARFLHWRGPGNLTEETYLAGPRVELYHHRRISLDAKFLLGPARLNVPATAIGGGTYLAYAPGAIADYRVSRRLLARVDYEYQIWPSFKGLQTGSGHGGLTPNGFSIGISYLVW